MAAMVWSQRRASEGLDRLVIMLDNFTPEECKTVSEQMEDQVYVNMWCWKPVAVLCSRISNHGTSAAWTSCPPAWSTEEYHPLM